MALVRMVKVAASTVSSPVLVRVAGPRAATTSPTSRSLKTSKAGSPTLSFFTQTWMSPERSRTLRKAALPKLRTASTRPATDQSPGSWAISVGRRLAVARVQVAGQVARRRGRCRRGSRRARAAPRPSSGAARRSRARWLPGPRTSDLLFLLDPGPRKGWRRLDGAPPAVNARASAGFRRAGRGGASDGRAVGAVVDLREDVVPRLDLIEPGLVDLAGRGSGRGAG